MSKNIVFCADGTWNGIANNDDDDKEFECSNVLKLFKSLKGIPEELNQRQPDEQEKVFTENGQVKQVAKYIHGVGDSNNRLIRSLEGVFGSGTIQRIVRGYTFISRHYRPGDKIFIIGFSRGAYTARALAGMITSQGLLDAEKLNLADESEAHKEQAYRWGTTVWAEYRRKAKAEKSWQDRLVSFKETLLGRASDPVDPKSMIFFVPIEMVAVWDTVGSLGIPYYDDEDRRIDLFRFADTALNKNVKLGRHAISLDEQRIDFTPVLWDARQGIQQVLFPGAHSDVGGGYPEKESGLSNGAYHWMHEELAEAGLLLNPHTYISNARALCHCPWFNKHYYKTNARQLTSPLKKNLPYLFDGNYTLAVHQSVLERCTEAQVSLQDPVTGEIVEKPYRSAYLESFINDAEIMVVPMK
ncbi:hypothetical protein CYR55_03360 [Chimaeribacter californicus]|uniref:T6SS Phospholipase effector Tle1-like catalytic domain-containing protein n=1 Tax=Chimaeribacter californicus TaxID=2060067 RepID=A0A2N5EEK5_9GAMM|nr:DUF2235 domain-containing protein [Chimaeribacter californicus]PLR40965.1 hypothetical protein CYR55_03360 [Chimaeribacter californicus]